MKCARFIFLLFLSGSLYAQESLPDSSMKEFSRLTCECVTLMKVDQGSIDNAIHNFSTCISANIRLYRESGIIKTEWLQDESWKNQFMADLEKRLTLSCPAAKTFFTREEESAPEPLPQNNPALFIGAPFMLAKKMVKNTNAQTASMTRWTAKDMGTNKIQIVFDIRYTFKNEAEATQYFSLKIDELSEGGEKLDKDLQQLGTSESQVFGANPKLGAAFGDLDMAQYNFVFRVKKVVAKVFVSASKKASYNDVLAFAAEAVKRIKLVK